MKRDRTIAHGYQWGVVCAAAFAAIGLQTCCVGYSKSQIQEEQTRIQSSGDVNELLDESTGTTLIVVREPIVLARTRTDVAANARDYLTLVAVQEDRGGKYTNWLLVHRWSTVDPRLVPEDATMPLRLRLFADGRELTFQPLDPVPRALQRGEGLFRPKRAVSRSAAYTVDVATLRYLGMAQVLSARFADDALPSSYTMWQDGRAALQAMVH